MNIFFIMIPKYYYSVMLHLVLFISLPPTFVVFNWVFEMRSTCWCNLGNTSGQFYRASWRWGMPVLLNCSVDSFHQQISCIRLQDLREKKGLDFKGKLSWINKEAEFWQTRCVQEKSLTCLFLLSGFEREWTSTRSEVPGKNRVARTQGTASTMDLPFRSKCLAEWGPL